MRTCFSQRSIAAAALLIVAASLHVNAQVAGDITTSTDLAGGLYTGTIDADGEVPQFTRVPAAQAPIGAAGGGGGVPTSIQTLQSISGYNPPPTTPIPRPTVNAGSVVAATDIPGYTGAAAGTGNNAANNVGGGGSSGALPRLGSLADFQSAPLFLSATAAVLGAAIVLL